MGRFTRNWDNILIASYAKKNYVTVMHEGGQFDGDISYARDVRVPSDYNDAIMNSVNRINFSPSYAINSPLYVQTFAKEYLGLFSNSSSSGKKFSYTPDGHNAFHIFTSALFNQSFIPLSTNLYSDNFHYTIASRDYIGSYPIAHGAFSEDYSPKILYPYLSSRASNFSGANIGVSLGSGALDNNDIYTACNLANPLKFNYSDNTVKNLPAVFDYLSVTGGISTESSSYDVEENKFSKTIVVNIKNISGNTISFSEIGLFAPISSWRTGSTTTGGVYNAFNTSLCRREDDDENDELYWVATVQYSGEVVKGSAPWQGCCPVMIWYDSFPTKTLAPGDYIQFRITQSYVLPH